MKTHTKHKSALIRLAKENVSQLLASVYGEFGPELIPAQYTGCRVGDVSRLSVADVNSDLLDKFCVKRRV